MNILKSKAGIALVFAALIMLLWAMWRESKTAALKSELGFNSDYLKDTTTDWSYGPNWDDYEPLSGITPN